MNLWQCIVAMFRNWFFFAWLFLSAFVLGTLFLIDFLRGV